MSENVTQHQFEIELNRNNWLNKPLLEKIYERFYLAIKSRLTPGNVLELGSGIGQIKKFIPNCITSDLSLNLGIDRVESAYALSFNEASLENIILSDVWHHLEFPGIALKEFHRVLVPHGRILILEPAMGLIPRIAYRLFHHEPLGFTDPISWSPPNGFELSESPYFAAQSRAWRIFKQGEDSKNLSGWRLRECICWSDFAYLGSGGFSKPSLYPSSLLRTIESFDRLLTKISPSIFAARMLIVLEKE